MNDDLGDRMKSYERLGATEQLMPRLPIVIRLDGRAFHTFTRGLKRPFDQNFHSLMDEVAKKLVHETNAVIGYTQSDEITLLLHNDDPRSRPYFDGRRDKINSVLASLTSVWFNLLLPGFLPGKEQSLPVFDCRCFTVPTRFEATNVLVWREQDATRNAISMAAQAYFSHNQLQGKSSSVMQEMLFSQQGINFNDYPAGFKRGRYFRRMAVQRPYTPEQRAKVSRSHPASVPGATYTRREVQKIELPVFTRITNRAEVVFDGAQPEVAAAQAAA